MANVKISNLTAATTPVAGTEVLPIVQSGSTVKVSIANLTPGLDTITAAKGGTGQTSYAVGDLLYASTTTALSKLADVATGNALISGGVSTAPSWGKIGLTTHVSGTLPTANGGTGLSSFTANGVVYASSTSALTTGSALVFDGTNLGVGTASPAGKLHVVGATNNWTQVVAGSTTSTQSYGLRIQAGTTSADTSFLIRDATNATDYLTVTGNGNLLVGVTSQVGSGRFCVKNDSTHNGIVSQDAGTSNFLYLGIDSTAQQVFYVTPAGNVRILSGATYGTISDRKYKTNIVDATPKLQDLLKIKVRNYNLVNNDSEKYIGWIAQEVEEVFPSMVFEDKDKDQDGNDLNTITKGVKESAFIPILVKAIQEQQALITTLTDRITALEARHGS